MRRSLLPARGRPVERMRKPPVEAWIIVAWLPTVHCGLPFAGSSSIVYWIPDPGTLRQRRGSAPTPFQAWLTGWSSVPLGAGTVVQRVQ